MAEEVHDNGYCPRQMAVYLTDECDPGACRHCMVDPAQVGCGESLDRKDALKAVKDADDVGMFQMYFPGGEPFLRFDLLCEAVWDALKLSKGVIVETNGFWAVSESKVRELLCILNSRAKKGCFGGVLLSLSLDEFHVDAGIPLKNIANIVKVWLKGDYNNIDLHLYCLCTPNSQAIFDAFMSELKGLGVNVSHLVGDGGSNERYRESLVEEFSIPIDDPDDIDSVKILSDLYYHDVIDAETNIFLAMDLAINSVQDVISALLLRGVQLKLEQVVDGKWGLKAFGHNKVGVSKGNVVTLFNRASDLREDPEFMGFYQGVLANVRATVLELICLGADGKYYMSPGHMSLKKLPIGDVRTDDTRTALQNANSDIVYRILIPQFKEMLLPVVCRLLPEVGGALSDPTVSDLEFGLRLFQMLPEEELRRIVEEAFSTRE